MGSEGRQMKGLDGSNPLRSANQSAIFGILGRSSRNSRVCAGSRSGEGTGEATIRTCSGRLCGFLSAAR